MVGRTLPILAVLLGSCWSLSADAAPRGSKAGSSLNGKKVRINVSTDVFSLTHFNPDGPGGDINRLGFGIGRLSGFDRGGSGTVLVDPAVLTIGVGGIIVQNRAGAGVLGAQVAFTIDGNDVGDDGGTTIGGRLLPYFNWVFGPFGRWRPFLGVRVGFGGAAAVPSPDNDAAETVNVIYPVVGVQGGTHIFVAPAVSIDLALTFDYSAVFADDLNNDLEKFGDALNVAFVNAGLSLWF